MKHHTVCDSRGRRRLPQPGAEGRRGAAHHESRQRQAGRAHQAQPGTLRRQPVAQADGPPEGAGGKLPFACLFV